MVCTPCPEGYVCSVEKLVSWGDILGIMGLVALVVIVLVLAIIGLVEVLEG